MNSDDEEYYDEYDPINQPIEEDDLDNRPDRLIPVGKRKNIGFSKPINLQPIKHINEEKRTRPLDLFSDYLKSYFFTKVIIEEYSLRVKSQLDNKMIINIDDIFEYFKDLGSSTYRIANTLIKGILDEDICSDIEPKYIREVLTRAIEQPHNYRQYDIAFIIDTTQPRNISSIISLVIVQKGECLKFENAYALNLICSRKCFSCGNILIGLYLYSILCHPQNIDTIRKSFLPLPLPLSSDILPYYGHPVLHVGLLEISGGYKNISGLCLYTKFGFVINPKLSGQGANCFGLDTNIAMIKRFKRDESIINDDTLYNISHDLFDIDHEKEKIIEIVDKTKLGYKKHIICKFKDKNVQLKLSSLYNKLKTEEKIYAELLIQSRWPINKIGSDFTPEFSEKMNVIETEIKKIKEQISLIETNREDITLNEIGMSGGRYTKKRKYRKYRKHKTNKKQRNKIKKLTRRYL